MRILVLIFLSATFFVSLAVDNLHFLYEEKNIAFYEDQNGFVLGISDEIIVKVENQKNIEFLQERFELKKIGQIAPNTYLLQTRSFIHTIEMVQLLKEYDYIEYVQPNFVKKIIYR